MERLDSTDISTEQEPYHVEMESRNNTSWWAGIISVLFHPLFMTTLLYAVVLYLAPELTATLSSEAKESLLYMVFVFSAAFPAFSSYVLYRTGTISSLKMKERPDRYLPMIFTSFIYLTVTYVFINQFKLGQIQVMVLIIGAVSAAVIVSTIITFYWKISIHSVGIGGITGFLLALQYVIPESELLFPIIGAILLSGLICSARLALHIHTSAEVLAGWLLGFLICSGTVLWFG